VSHSERALRELVCDLDTGIDPTHIDLAGKVDVGVSTSMVISEPDIIDYNEHGTFVSSQMAMNGIGMASAFGFGRIHLLAGTHCKRIE
jgi:subtilisin family serine protease